MPRKKSNKRTYTSEDYQRLYDSIEEEIDIEELSVANIRELISNRAYDKLDRGRKDLILLAKTLREDIFRASSIKELNEIREDSKNLVTHRDDILDLILIKSADLLEEEIVVEKWGVIGKVEVLRDAGGRFISWRKI